jgi:peptide/nickel transport system permease protein
VSAQAIATQAAGADTGLARHRPAGVLAILWRNPRSRLGLVLFGAFVFLSVFGPWLAPYNPADTSFAPMLAPSARHLLGTTQSGADVFSQLVAGTRVSVVVSLTVGAIATFLAMLVGVTAGYVGGWVDDVLSFLTNVFLVLPGLPLLIVLASYAPGAGMSLLVLIVGFTGWPWGARTMRAQVSTLRARDFVVAARLAGDGLVRILAREIVPNMLSLVMANFLGASTAGLLAAVGLEFLGFGNPNQVSWGSMLYWAQNSSALLQGQWAWILAPGLCIALLGMSLVLINFGFDVVSNPRLQEEGE